MEIRTYLNEQRQLVEEHLAHAMLEPVGPFAQHIEAMRYSLFAGGKRIRPILCLAGAAAINSSEETRRLTLPVACAFECIHSYSLIHDDLPAMDNDDLRRGKPTNHIIFGEAAAILAGDGLLTFAFELLAGPATVGISDTNRIRLIHTIAQAAGPLGMVGGQSLDMIHAAKQVDYEQVDYAILRCIHRSKTGALITASVVCGALVASASESQIAALTIYGNKIGLAFQIVDDLLDVVATTAELGKPAGSDVQASKLTYPALFGIDTSRTMAQEAHQAATAALASFDEKADPLRALAHFIVDRTK